MNANILNPAFQHPADGWYMIEPRGEHPCRRGELVQVIDGAAAAAIVNRFNADAAAGKLSHGREMLVDHEHFKHDLRQETRAYGWLQQLQSRADGIYGQIRWSGTGKQAVDGGDYRFFSTEYDPADLKILNGGQPRRVRPLRLDGLTLTNDPNNKGGRPITNRDGAAPFAGSAETAEHTTKKKHRNMNTITQALGLAGEAGEDAILAAVTRLQNRVSELESLAAENTRLKNRLQQADDELVAGLFTERRITDDKLIARLKPVLAGITNREERLAFLDDCGFQAAEKAAATRVLNRGAGAPPATGFAGQDEKAVADKIINRAHELKGAAPARSFDACWRQAQQEVLPKN